jgi:hypothetical protein
MEELKGLVIFTGIVMTYVFVLLGCLERRLKRVDRVIEETKYVN